MNFNIYRCPVCGNVIIKLVDSGVVPVCCGEEMQVLSARTTDSLPDLRDKHVPQVTLINPCTLQVKIGSMPHPASDEHHICFNLLVSERGLQVHFPRIGAPVSSSFYCGNDTPKSIYTYCNLHNLWACHQLPATSRHDSCDSKPNPPSCSRPKNI